MLKNCNIIAITGIMGVGKTTIGQKLASKLGYYFVDLDQEIEDREGMSINQIFSKKSEGYFRELEKSIIKEIITRDEKMVISLGGGSFVEDDIRKILLEKTVVIFLNASIDVILHRIGNKNNRPLLNNVDKRKVLQDLMDQRYKFYSQAHLEFESGVVSQDEMVEDIIKKIIDEKNRL